MTIACFLQKFFPFKRSRKPAREHSSVVPFQDDAEYKTVSAVEDVTNTQKIQESVSQANIEVDSIGASFPLPVVPTPPRRTGLHNNSFCNRGEGHNEKEESDFVLTGREEPMSVNESPCRSVLFSNNSKHSDGNSGRVFSKGLPQPTCGQEKSSVPSNRWVGVDVDDEELDVTGSTLAEPITPHSYSSMMMGSESKRFNSGATDGYLNICRSVSSSGYNSRGFWRYGNSVNNAVEDMVGRHTSSERVCGSRSSERVVSFYPSDMVRPPVGHNKNNAAEMTGDTKRSPLTGRGTSFERDDATDNSAFRRVQDESFSSFYSKAPAHFLQNDCIPPEPKELVNVNMGRSRSLPLREKVMECRWVDKRAVGYHQKLLNEKYVIYTKWKLGVGSYSKAVLCYNLVDKVYYAMKVLDRVKLKKKGIGIDCALYKVKREIAIMKKLRHNNIVALVEVIDDPRSRKIYLVLELAERGEIMSLRDDGTVIPRNNNTALSEGEVVRVMRDIVSAAMYAHHLGIAHRDIKPQNILLKADGSVKLSDFGVSIIVDDSAVSVRREGSVAFLPPEMLVSSVVNVAPLRRKSCSGDVFSAAPSISTLEKGQMENSTKHSEVQGNEKLTECDFSAEEIVRPASAPAFASVWSTTTNTHITTEASQHVTPQVDLFKADVFALGVTAFVLLMGRLPWRARDARSQYNAILSEQDPFEAAFRETYVFSVIDTKQPQARTHEADEVEIGESKMNMSVLKANKFKTKLDCGGDNKTELDKECVIHITQSEQPIHSTNGNEWEMENSYQTNNVLGRYSLEKISNSSHLTWDGSECNNFGHVTSLSFSTNATTNTGDVLGKKECLMSVQVTQSSTLSRDVISAPSPSISAKPSCQRPGEYTDSMHNTSFFSSLTPLLPAGYQEQNGFADIHTEHHNGEESAIIEGNPHSDVKEFLLNPELQSGTLIISDTACEPLNCMEENLSCLVTRPSTTTTATAVVVVDTESITEKKLSTTRIMTDTMEIQRSLPATKIHGPISTDAIDFIRRCLHVNSAERSTMEELYNHPWIQNLVNGEKKEEGVKVLTSEALLPTCSLTNITKDLSDGTTTVEKMNSLILSGGDAKQVQSISREEDGKILETIVRRNSDNATIIERDYLTNHIHYLRNVQESCTQQNTKDTEFQDLPETNSNNFVISTLSSSSGDTCEENILRTIMRTTSSRDLLISNVSPSTDSGKICHTEAVQVSPSLPSSEGLYNITEDIADAVTHVTNKLRLLRGHEVIPVPSYLAATLWERRSVRMRPCRRQHFEEDPLDRYSRDDICMAIYTVNSLKSTLPLHLKARSNKTSKRGGDISQLSVGQANHGVEVSQVKTHHGAKKSMSETVVTSPTFTQLGSATSSYEKERHKQEQLRFGRSFSSPE